MRRLATLLPFLASALFASPASAEEPISGHLVQLARGLFATGAQLSTYGVCRLAIDDEDTCVKVADRALRAVTALR